MGRSQIYFFCAALCILSLEQAAADQRDSLLTLGQRYLREGRADTAVATFSDLTKAFPKDAHIQSRLGYAYLKNRDFEKAETAFKTAKRLDQNLAEAYVGLGLVYAERPASGLSAYSNFRKAVGEAKRATKLDSTYGPAYRLLGELYERFQEDHQKAVDYYLKYIQVESDNPDGLYYFGLACVQADQHDQISAHIIPYINAHDPELRLLPLAAAGYFHQKEHRLALNYYERYLQRVDKTERAYYTDISLVASEKEWHAYQSLSEESEKLDYLQKFWRRRDSDILTQINERIVEHYRRVWYARTFFSKKISPYDQRGEVYIRYGEPDYRSRSNQREFVTSPEVEAVRNRMTADIWGPAATYHTFTGPVFPIRSQRKPFEGNITNQSLNTGVFGTDAGEDDAILALNPGEEAETLGFQFEIPDLVASSPFDLSVAPRAEQHFLNYSPVTSDREFETVPWETWTYTQLQGGVEFTFTDEVGNGHFDFAPMPPLPQSDNRIASVARLMEYAPGVIYQQSIGAVPDYYRPSVGKDALHFFYDVADFRGTNGKTIVEVYYGIPPAEVTVGKGDRDYLIHTKGTLALSDASHENIYRTHGILSYQNSREFPKTRGVFIPDLIRIEASPGEKYQLQVQLEDELSGRVGAYKQELTVSDFNSEGVKISGIQLASSITDTGTNDRLKKKDIYVSPMASRSYPLGSRVFAYFEIYNLKRDTFGQTRYKVQYRVQFNPRNTIGLAGVITSGIRTLLRQQKPQISVTYEQVGTDEAEREYVELDLKKAKPGVNVVEITVQDKVSGEKATREVVFFYGGSG